MAPKNPEIRADLRALIDRKEGSFLELQAIVKKAGNLSATLKAAKDELKDEKDLVKIALLRNIISMTYLDKGDSQESEKEALIPAGDDTLPNRARASAYAILTLNFLDRKDFTVAEAYCKKALSLAGENEDPVFAFVVNTMATVHFYKERYSIALEYFRTFNRLAEKAGSLGQVIASLDNIALTLTRLGRYDEVIEHLNKALKLAQESGGEIQAGYTLNNIGQYHLYRGDMKKALEYINSAMEVFESMEISRMLPLCNLDLALVYLDMGNYETARKHVDTALSLAEDDQSRGEVLPRAYRMLGSIQAAQGNALAGIQLIKSIDLYESRKDDPPAEDLGFALLDYGKFLLAQNEKEGAQYVNRAAEILKNRPKSYLIGKALRALEEVFETMPRECVPAVDDRMEKLNKDRENLKKVLDILKAINSETEMIRLLNMIVETAIAITGAERGVFALASEDSYYFAAEINFFKDITSERDHDFIREVISSTIMDGRTVIISDIKKSGDVSSISSIEPRTVKAFFATPLIRKNEIIGSLYLDSRYAILDMPTETNDLLVMLMEQAAIIIEKTKLYEEVRVLSRKLGKKLEKTRSDLERKQKELEKRYDYENIVGESPKMMDLFSLLDKVVESDLPVYIYGESGTGKELIAKAIHYNSARKERHFVALNCAAIPENLLESELFGYGKGAFTGADKAKVGLFEIADGGTLFLDEIGNMGEKMQQKLLRVLQENEIRRIGEKNPIKINVRILSASNTQLQDLIGKDRFREDLFYRLNVLPITVPPLRERLEDISVLAEYFWEKVTGTPMKASPEEKKKLFKVLTNYDWPGNIREFENEILRIISFGSGELDPKYLSEHILSGYVPQNDEPIQPIQGRVLTLQEMEKSCIVAALREAKGNKVKAAELLGIPRSSLYNKISKYGIDTQIKR
ncbi:MAG: sigma 54-interacting transcriptional regulator [Planctomycetota bacterium]|jgi:transcriptional regulator with GAF, ATPase, and Fis domain/Tfp pilus assembly protein PilF